MTSRHNNGVTITINGVNVVHVDIDAFLIDDNDDFFFFLGGTCWSV